MRFLLSALGRFLGAVLGLVFTALVLVAMGFVLSFLGCDVSDGPGPDDYSLPDPPVLTDPAPPPSYDIPAPADPGR
jgi:hypothetical protein